MVLYIVRNDREEEVAAYTNSIRAHLVADELQSNTQRPFKVEPLDSCTPENHDDTTDHLPLSR
jgi:hypothetical protein